MTKIAFVGGGNMATSLIGGLVERGTGAEIAVSDPLPERRDALTSRFSVAASSDNLEAIRGAQTVVLAVKPQVMRDVATQIAAAAKRSRPLLVSIAAGVPISSLTRWLGYDAAVVRAMPNTPALLGCGATALYASAEVSEAQRAQADEVLSAAGITIWLDDEAQIDAVTAVSGSGPAYFFLLMEHMIEAGVDLGLTAEVARRLTLQTALGAARMALEGEDEPGALREKVTSPGGTTERALRIFAEGGIGKLVRAALTGARDRSRELASGG